MIWKGFKVPPEVAVESREPYRSIDYLTLACYLFDWQWSNLELYVYYRLCWISTHQYEGLSYTMLAFIVTLHNALFCF